MLCSRECRVPAEAVECHWWWRGPVRFEVLECDEAIDSREVAPPLRGARGTFGMSGSTAEPPRLPISVDVRSIEATAGVSMSCFAAVVEPLEGPRDATDMSEARLLRPEAFSSRSVGSMAFPSCRSRRRGGRKGVSD